MKILIDSSYKEKCSPDNRLSISKYTRKLADSIVKSLLAKGYDAELLAPEKKNVPINERLLRINSWCNRLGTDSVLVVLIDLNNSSENVKWYKATGWEAWTSPGQGDKLANSLYDEAEKALKPLFPNIPLLIRFDVTEDKQELLFTNTKCQVALTKNFFIDSKDDVAWLETDLGFNTIADIHVNGIIRYINSL